MQIDIITAFPKMVSIPLQESIVGRAISKNLVRIHIHDLRDWTEDKHRTIDDTPYGGGAGANRFRSVVGTVAGSFFTATRNCYW